MHLMKGNKLKTNSIMWVSEATDIQAAVLCRAIMAAATLHSTPPMVRDLVHEAACTPWLCYRPLSPSKNMVVPESERGLLIFWVYWRSWTVDISYSFCYADSSAHLCA